MAQVVLTKVTRNGQITLPVSIRRALRLEEGDYIEMRIADSGIVLVPKKLVDSSQAYFWSPPWQAAEREASEDIAEGRVFDAKDADDLVAALEKARKKKQ
jgi:antitoxin PrlF